VLTISIKLKSKEVIRIKGVKLQFKNGDILFGLVFVQYRVRRLAGKNVYLRTLRNDLFCVELDVKYLVQFTMTFTTL